MKYYLIQKMHVVDGNLTWTMIGYTTNEEHKNTLDAGFEAGIKTWVTDNQEDLDSGNLHPINYFDENPDFHSITKTVDSVDGLNLTEITDLTKL